MTKCVTKQKQTTISFAHFFVGKSQLETSFRRINTENTATSLPIQTKELILDDTLSIERIIQGTNGASVSRGSENILDMMQGGVDKELRIGTSRRTDIPRTRFDANIVTNAAKLFKLTIRNDDTVFAQNGNLASVGRPNHIFNLGSGNFY